jgi:hypothetical protein
MNLKDSILKTIAFFDIFDFPLTAEEIKQYLYNCDRPIHIKEIKGTLDEMEEDEKIEKIHDYHVLKGRTNLVDTRKARKFIAEKFWNRTRQYCQYIVKIPFVEMVAVCNNLAYDNPTDQSDIDLFIVIRENRMWLSRLWITLVFQFFGVRRHGDKIAGRFCLSFFVTPKKLNMEPLALKPEDPYMAYWTLLLEPIYGQNMYAQFTEANKNWLKNQYGLNMPDPTGKKFSFIQAGGLNKFWEFILRGSLGALTEWLLKKTFKKRTLRKAKQLGPEASIVVTDDMLKFHNLDRRREFLNNWKTKIEKDIDNI